MNSVSSYSSHRRSHCSSPALPSPPVEVSGVLDNTIYSTAFIVQRYCHREMQWLPLRSSWRLGCVCGVCYTFRTCIQCPIQKLKLGKKNPAKKTGFKRVGETPNDVRHTHTHTHTGTLHTPSHALHTHTPSQAHAHAHTITHPHKHMPTPTQAHSTHPHRHHRPRKQP